MIAKFKASLEKVLQGKFPDHIKEVYLNYYIPYLTEMINNKEKILKNPSPQQLEEVLKFVSNVSPELFPQFPKRSLDKVRAACQDYKATEMSRLNSSLLNMYVAKPLVIPSQENPYDIVHDEALAMVFGIGPHSLQVLENESHTTVKEGKGTALHYQPGQGTFALHEKTIFKVTDKAISNFKALPKACIGFTMNDKVIVGIVDGTTLLFGGKELPVDQEYVSLAFLEGQLYGATKDHGVFKISPDGKSELAFAEVGGNEITKCVSLRVSQGHFYVATKTTVMAVMGGGKYKMLFEDRQKQFRSMWVDSVGKVFLADESERKYLILSP